LLLQRERETQFLLSLLRLQKIIAHLLQISALKLSGDITVDYLIDSSVKFLPILRIRQQAKLQFLFFCLAKPAK
jgi:hypothetical protein